MYLHDTQNWCGETDKLTDRLKYTRASEQMKHRWNTENGQENRQRQEVENEDIIYKIKQESSHQKPKPWHFQALLHNN